MKAMKRIPFKRLPRLWMDRAGGVLVYFAIAAPVLIGVVGASVAAVALLLLCIMPALRWDEGAQTSLVIALVLLVSGVAMMIRSRTRRRVPPETHTP